MAKRELLYVRVETLPNGYAFTVGSKEYMCYTEEQLVDEVFTRIAIGEREYLDKENVSAIMEACAKWQTIGDALKANSQLLAETRRAQRHECLANTAQAKANERAEKIKKERDELWNENIQLNMELETLSKKMKYFDNILVGDLPKDDRHKKNHKKR
jgi:hypothetical protein